MTYAELKAQLDAFTPEQLVSEVVWVGDERGGKVLRVWIAEEDWIYLDVAAEPRSTYEQFKDSADEDERDMYAEAMEAKPCIPKGTPQLMVDP